MLNKDLKISDEYMEHKLLKNIMLSSLCCMPCATFATENNGDSKLKGLSLGIGAVVSSDVYVGEKKEATVIPAISYEGEHFFVRGLYAGTDLYKSKWITLNAIGSVNLMHLDVDKLRESDLAKHNLSKSQLEDRDRSLDLGLEALIRLPYGILSLQAVNDVTGASKAAEMRINYQYFWRINNQLSFVPNAGFDWMTSKRSNYYYGVFDSEVAMGVPAYKPDQVVVPHISLGANYSFSDNIRLTGVVSHKFFPNKVYDSPIIDSKSSSSLLVAVAYKF